MDEFIKTLTEQIRCVKAREGVAREMRDHISDQAKAYEKSGIDPEKAVEMAVHEMGDPVEIGVSLDRIHRPQMNWRMLVMTFILSIAGLFALYCVYGPSTLVMRQCIYMAAGFLVILAVNFIDYSILGKCGYAAYILLTAVLFIGARTLPRLNGRVPAMSALVYLYVPLFAGILYQMRGMGYGAVVLSAAVAFLTFVFSGSFSGSALVGANIFLIMIVMTIIAVRKDMFHVNRKYTAIALAGVIVLPVIALAVMVPFMESSFRTERIRAFFHPDRYSGAGGYIYAVIRGLLGSLRPFGDGRALDIYESGYHLLGEAGGFVPLQIMRRYGIFSGVLLLLLFAAFGTGAVKIVRAQKNRLGRLVSASCFLVLSVNCLEGALMNLGLFPATTVCMPFITRGGSVAFLYSVLIGLLLSVHRYENVTTDEKSADRSKWRIRIKFEKI